MKNTLKKIILTSFILGFLFNAKGQELINEKFYSKSVNDSIDIKVWLPKDYDNNKSYPVIYELAYDHSDYIAITLNHLYECPSALVVHAKFIPGTSYEKSTLSSEGEKYYQFLKDELLPHIEKKYKTLHKSAIGFSYGADYANYVFRTNPELFDAYMIHAIESPNYEVNFSEYTNKLKEKKDYYIAIANDVERRVKFANTLYDNLSKNDYLNIVKREFKSAEHSYSLLYSLADGLLFTYKDYVSYREPTENESFSVYFTNIINEIEEKYGTVQYGSLLYEAFDYLNQESPKAEVKTVLDKLYQDKTNVTDLDLFNVGYSLFEDLEFYDLSVTTYKEAIERGKNLSETERNIPLNNSYGWLADVYYKQKKYDKVFETLQVGYEFTNSKYLLRRYASYSFAIGDEVQIKKGIEALNTLISLPKSKDSYRNPEQPKETIYLLYAKGYWKLKKEKESRKYLKKSLEVNPNYKSALGFQETIQ